MTQTPAPTTEATISESVRPATSDELEMWNAVVQRAVAEGHHSVTGQPAAVAALALIDQQAAALRASDEARKAAERERDRACEQAGAAYQNGYEAAESRIKTLERALDDIRRARLQHAARGFPVGLYPDPASWMEDRAKAALGTALVSAPAREDEIARGGAGMRRASTKRRHALAPNWVFPFRLPRANCVFVAQSVWSVRWTRDLTRQQKLSRAQPARPARHPGEGDQP